MSRKGVIHLINKLPNYHSVCGASPGIACFFFIFVLLNCVQNIMILFKRNDLTIYGSTLKLAILTYFCICLKKSSLAQFSFKPVLAQSQDYKVTHELKGYLK